VKRRRSLGIDVALAGVIGTGDGWEAEEVEVVAEVVVVVVVTVFFMLGTFSLREEQVESSALSLHTEVAAPPYRLVLRKTVSKS
jgi:hypothetical protein